jgi:hypothetical protein
MRKNYKNIIGDYVVILEKKDKKPVEPSATEEQENSGN